MIELPAIAWTAIGAIVGAIPAMSIAFWRECRDRRIAKHRAAMEQLKVNREIILKGMERNYELFLNDDSDSFQPRSNSDAP